MASAPYGALYSAPPPSSTAPPTLDALLKPSIKYVRLQWIDLINTPRTRVLSAAYFRKLYAHPGVRAGVGIPTIALGLVGLNVADGFGAVGEWLFVPDLRSWRVCLYATAPGGVMTAAATETACVMGWFE